MVMRRASNRAIDLLRRRVGAALAEHGLSGRKLLIAVSGGPDSLALLHALHSLSDEHRLTLCGAHLNHRLRGADSDADADFAEESFRCLGIDYAVDSADVAGYRREHRLSLEDAARRVRYAFLAGAATEHNADAIALGHTADDQAETVLMHITRGSGLDGLRGMQPFDRRTIKGKPVSLFRPLLGVSRAETQAYCEALGLDPRIDVSNSSPEFLRNRIRLELVPLLEQLNPSIQAALIRLAGNATQDSDFIREQTDTVWDEVTEVETSADGDVIVFDTNLLQSRHPAVQSRLLRRGISEVGGEITQAHILEMMRLTDGGPGKTLDLPGRLTFATDYGRALIGSADDVAAMLSTLPTMQGEQALAVPSVIRAGRWLIKASVETDMDDGESENFPSHPNPLPEGEGIMITEMLDMDRVGEGLRIRGRRPGDRFQPLGMEQSKSLREFMIDARIPRRWRDGLPLVGVGARHRVRTGVAHCTLGAGHRRDDASAAYRFQIPRVLRRDSHIVSLHYAVQARAGRNTRHLSAAGYGHAVYLVNLGAEAKRRCAADGLVHAESVDRGCLFDKVTDCVPVHPMRDEDINVLESLRVQLGPNLLDQSRSYAASLGRRAEIHAPKPVTEGTRHVDRLLRLVLECVQYRDPGDFQRQVAIVGLKRLYSVSQQKRKGVLHIPDRGHAGQPSAQHR